MEGKGHWERKGGKKSYPSIGNAGWVLTKESAPEKISFDMIKSHNRKCCCNTGLVSSDKYLI